MLEIFLAWTWITTQGEPFNIKVMVISFPFILQIIIQLLVHIPNIYVHVCICLAFLDQLNILLLDLLLVLACFVVSWFFFAVS